MPAVKFDRKPRPVVSRKMSDGTTDRNSRWYSSSADWVLDRPGVSPQQRVNNTCQMLRRIYFQLMLIVKIPEQSMAADRRLIFLQQAELLWVVIVGEWCLRKIEQDVFAGCTEVFNFLDCT